MVSESSYHSWSTEDLCEYVKTHLPESEALDINEKLNYHSIRGAHLDEIKPDDLLYMGITKWGHRRSLLGLIEKIRRAAAPKKEATSTSATNAALPTGAATNGGNGGAIDLLMFPKQNFVPLSMQFGLGSSPTPSTASTASTAATNWSSSRTTSPTGTPEGEAIEGEPGYNKNNTNNNNTATGVVRPNPTAAAHSVPLAVRQSIAPIISSRIPIIPNPNSSNGVVGARFSPNGTPILPPATLSFGQGFGDIDQEGTVAPGSPVDLSMLDDDDGLGHSLSNLSLGNNIGSSVPIPAAPTTLNSNSSSPSTSMFSTDGLSLNGPRLYSKLCSIKDCTGENCDRAHSLSVLYCRFCDVTGHSGDKHRDDTRCMHCNSVDHSVLHCKRNTDLCYMTGARHNEKYCAYVHSPDNARCAYCVAEGTPVGMYIGVSIPVEQLWNNNKIEANSRIGAANHDAMDVKEKKSIGLNQIVPVLSFGEHDQDKASTGIVKRNQVNWLDQKTKPCVELTLEDGRTIVCTPDHLILTAVETKHRIVYEYKAAKDLVISRYDFEQQVHTPGDRIQCSVNYPLLRINDVDRNYQPTGFDNYSFEQWMAIARMTGLFVTDGSMSPKSIFICLSHPLDVEQFKFDYQFVFNSDLSFTMHANHCTYHASVNINSAFGCLLQSAGYVAGDRMDMDTKLPSFIMDSNGAIIAPRPIVVEFLGGLYGGDGFAPRLKKNGSFDDRAICFMQSKYASHAKELKNYLLSIKKLLTYCGVSEANIEVSTPRRFGKNRNNNDIPSTITGRNTTVAAKYEQQIVMDFDGMLSFSDNIGFRYCIDKTMRLSVAVAYRRMLSLSVNQVRSFLKQVVAEALRLKAMNAKDVWRQAHIRVRQSMFSGNDGVIGSLPNPINIACFYNKNKANWEGWIDAYAPVLMCADWLKNAKAYQLFRGDSKKTNAGKKFTKSYSVPRDMLTYPLFELSIINRRDVGPKKVYDITVETPRTSEPNETAAKTAIDYYRTFIVNGVAVHNCLSSNHILAMCASETIRCIRCRNTGHHDSNPLKCPMHPEYPYYAAILAKMGRDIRDIKPKTYKNVQDILFYDWRDAGVSLIEFADGIARYKLAKKGKQAINAPKHEQIAMNMHAGLGGNNNNNTTINGITGLNSMSAINPISSLNNSFSSLPSTHTMSLNGSVSPTALSPIIAKHNAQFHSINPFEKRHDFVSTHDF